jgi:hippurate hydrolase
MPHHGIDPVVVGAHIVTALQSIVARNLDPMDTAVVSTTQIHAGDTWNVIPQECVLRGTVRTFKKPVQDMIEARIEKIARNVAAGFGAEVTKWRYERRYPPPSTARRRPSSPPTPRPRWSARERQPQPDAGDGQRGLRLDAAEAARLLHLDRQRRRRRLVHGPQPGLRLQRRDPADRRSYWATLVEQQLAAPRRWPQAAEVGRLLLDARVFGPVRRRSARAPACSG